MTSSALWQPSQERIEQSNLWQFTQQINHQLGLSLITYAELWQWSIDQPELFWKAIWDYSDVVGEPGERVLIDGSKMPGAQWFPDASLNFAQNLLRKNDASDALVFWGEDKTKRRLSWQQLHQQVSRCQQSLLSLGVEEGDRVAGLLPNMPEAIIAMLATSSIGAVWCSASPDFGVEGVIDRFGQLEPKVLFCVDYYFYSDKKVDCKEKNVAISKRLPSLVETIDVSYESDRNSKWHQTLEQYGAKDVEFKQLPFSHPLFVMFSSGTTGVPKCIVHSAGGTLLQHLKEHQLHADIKPNDRLFYFTTCGWMMWNWLASGLASRATLLLYDGNPLINNKPILFDLADAEGMTQFGTSAKYIESIEKAGLSPKSSHSLTSIRSVFSTGSPLAPNGFRYVYQHIKVDVALASISGGTDILSCFALGCPTLPVYIGELQCRGLGMAVDVLDLNGKSVTQEKGELVCTKPFPSMPIGFWNDADGSRYHNAYFNGFENIWCHGDYVELTANQGMIFHGRSDATLNPGGVRIGTAEIYRQVDAMSEVLESVVIGQQWQDDVRVILFVRLASNTELDDTLEKKIKQTIRSRTTPRHVPAKIIAVEDIPRTKSGKIVELAVKNVVHDLPIKNSESLANPDALQLFKALPALEH